MKKLIVFLSIVVFDWILFLVGRYTVFNSIADGFLMLEKQGMVQEGSVSLILFDISTTLLVVLVTYFINAFLHLLNMREFIASQLLFFITLITSVFIFFSTLVFLTL